MKQLIRFECKKLLNRTFSIVTIITLLFGIMALSFWIIAENYTDNVDGSEISGLEAIKANKALQAIGAGELNKEMLLEAFHQYQAVTNNPSNYAEDTKDLKNEVYLSKISPYEDILSLLRRNYSPVSGYNYYILSSVSEDMIDQFYEVRHNKINELVNMDYSSGNYTQAEKNFILNKDLEIKTPFFYDYAKGWSDILELAFSTVFLLIGLSVCVIVAPIFAYEYQTGADAIVLSTRFGRKQIIRAKMIAGFLVSSGIYLFATSFFIIITITAYGIQGWNASFQILSFTSFYNLTMLQVFLCGLLLNYLVVMAIMSTTMMLSSICKSSFSTVIISTLWVFVPLFVPSSKSSRAFNYFLDLLPAKAVDTYKVFSLYDVFSFGEIVLSLPVVILLSSICLVFITLPMAWQGFKKHQVM